AVAADADGTLPADVPLEVGANGSAATAQDVGGGQLQDAVAREVIPEAVPEVAPEVIGSATQPIAPAPATTAGCDGSAINQPQDLGAVSDYESLKKDIEGVAEGLAQ